MGLRGPKPKKPSEAKALAFIPTDKDRLFLRELPLDWDVSRAAQRAGYVGADGKVDRRVYRLCKCYPDIVKRMREQVYREIVSKATHPEAIAGKAEIAEIMTEILRASVTDFLPDNVVRELGLKDRPNLRALASVEVDEDPLTGVRKYRYKTRDPIAAAERLAKLLGHDAIDEIRAKEIQRAGGAATTGPGVQFVFNLGASAPGSQDPVIDVRTTPVGGKEVQSGGQGDDQQGAE